jgi:probable F420-dependent oxidoreductase
MKLGVALPIVDIGGEPAALREFAQAAEEIGYHGIAAPDHVLGVNVASRPNSTQGRARSTDWYHDPFVLFGFLAGCTKIADFSTQVLILAQRQTVLVAKQAACLDVLPGGRFWLGIGVGWNEVEFVGLNENFHNRGRRSGEQLEVTKALWAQPHVSLKGKWHTIEDAGINPLPTGRKIPLWYGGHADLTLRRCASGATAGCRAPTRPGRRQGRPSPRCSAMPRRPAAIRRRSASTRAFRSTPAAKPSGGVRCSCGNRSG